ncbi:hypothetical protein Bca4012_058891 [Brassica carinata]
MTFCQGDRSMAPICEVDETKIKVASRARQKPYMVDGVGALEKNAIGEEDVMITFVLRMLKKSSGKHTRENPHQCKKKTKEKVLKRLDKVRRTT